MKCTKCGTEIVNGAAFCHTCGSKIQKRSPDRHSASISAQFLKRHRGVIFLASITALVYFLLFAICSYTREDWLFSVAYSIATFSLIFLWLIVVVVKYAKINRGFKASLILLLSGIFTITSNPFIAYLTGEDYMVIDSFVYAGGAVNHTANGIAFLCLITGAVISLIVGICLSLRKRNH